MGVLLLEAYPQRLAMSIPVVDISSVDHGLVGSPVVQDVHTAFTTVGFMFITGHGIPRELVSFY